MNEHLKGKLEVLYQLVKRGTEGEKQEAERVLNRLIEKHQLHGIDLDSLDKPMRKFKYSTMLEHWLLAQLLKFFIGEEVLDTAKRSTYKERKICLPLTHLDFIKVECAYEYFRRHMKAQWKKNCEPELRKCKKVKTRNKRRTELQSLFFCRYIIASKLIDTKELTQVTQDEMSMQELKDRLRLAGVEGGEFNVQVQGAHALPEHTYELHEG